MIIFLDFDNTLFAADEFIEYVRVHEDFVERLTKENSEAPFSRWLFGDVKDFLHDARAKGYLLVIVSSAIDTKMQLEKIIATGVKGLVDDIIVTPLGKGKAIEEWIARQVSLGNEKLNGHYFVDDMPGFISEVNMRLPDMTCVRIERHELPPFMEMKNRDMADRVIESLDDLRAALALPERGRS